MRLLIKLASRSRPDKLLSVAKKYIEFARDTSNTQFIISLDVDDPTVTEELKCLLTAIHPCIRICMGTSNSKIHAMNRDIPETNTFDILLLASDDMVPEVMGYDNIIREKMKKHYSDTDGVLFFNDGYNGRNLNTLSILGCKYYRRFGYVYYPGYKSFYCDNEFMVVADRLKKQTYFETTIIRHQHFVTGYAEFDSLYQRNSIYIKGDMALYTARNTKKPPKKLLSFLNTHR
jgi:hypothetical protein